MEASVFIRSMEVIARGLEVSGVAIIASAFLYGAIRGLLHSSQKKEDAYERLKVFIEEHCN